MEITPNSILRSYVQKNENNTQFKKFLGLSGASVGMLGPLLYAGLTGTTVAAMLGVSSVALPFTAIMAPAAIGLGYVFKQSFHKISYTKEQEIEKVLSSYGLKRGYSLSNNEQSMVQNLVSDLSKKSLQELKNIPKPSAVLKGYENHTVETLFNNKKNYDLISNNKKFLSLGVAGALLGVAGLAVAGGPLLAIGGVAMATSLAATIGKGIQQAFTQKNKFQLIQNALRSTGLYQKNISDLTQSEKEIVSLALTSASDVRSRMKSIRDIAANIFEQDKPSIKKPGM
jgi:hypothetical protein